MDHLENKLKKFIIQNQEVLPINMHEYKCEELVGHSREKKFQYYVSKNKNSTRCIIFPNYKRILQR